MLECKSEEVEFKKLIGVHRQEILAVLETYFNLHEDPDTPAEELQNAYEKVFDVLKYYFDAPSDEDRRLISENNDTIRFGVKYISALRIRDRLETIDTYLKKEGTEPKFSVPVTIFVVMIGWNSPNIRKLGNTLYKAEPLVNVNGTLAILTGFLKEYLE